MKARKQWKLKSGLLYAGLHDLSAALVGPDDALIFDERDNPDVKVKFWSAVLKQKFEVEFL